MMNTVRPPLSPLNPQHHLQNQVMVAIPPQPGPPPTQTTTVQPNLPSGALIEGN